MGMIEDILGQVMKSGGAPQTETGATTATAGQPGGDALTNVLGGLLGTDKEGANPILLAIMQFIQKNGGVMAIIQRLREKGFAGEVGSWVGTGSNQGITPQQIGEVFDEDSIDGLAQDLNTTPDQAKRTLADTLPELINQFSPDGALPDNANDLLSSFTQMLSTQKPR